MSFQKKYRPRRKLISDINLVPYIDVMLVLLLIFMITAPLLTQGVQVQLPSASAKAIPPKKDEPIIVSVNSQGELFLNTAANPIKPISPQDLMSSVSTQLTHAQTRHREEDVYVKGDRHANYGAVMKAMVLLQKAGAVNVGLVTQSPSNDQDRLALKNRVINST